MLARDGDEIVYARVDPKSDGVTLTQQHTVASDTQYRVDLDHASAEVIDRRGWAVLAA